MSHLPPFKIPERILSKLQPARLETLRYLQNKRTVSASSAQSLSSQISLESTTSEFLEAKIGSLYNEQEYLEKVQRELVAGKQEGEITTTEFQDVNHDLLARFTSAKQTIDVLESQRKFIEDDISKDVSLTVKKQRVNAPFDNGLIERAYVDVIIPRVMGAVAKQRKDTFDQSDFKQRVVEYYSTQHPEGGDYATETWCHVQGRFLRSSDVKAAHIVPKCLSDEEIAHVFGVKAGVRGDEQNALCLSSSIERLLDEGIIAIIPVPDSITLPAGPMSEPTTWRCIVLDETKNGNFLWSDGGRSYFVRDLNNRPLTFLNEKRPRRRYLYFRFLVSYLCALRQAKRALDGKDEAAKAQAKKFEDITAKCDARKFWPSGGSWLDKSTIVTMARSVSGVELPGQFIRHKTFDSPNESDGIKTGMVLAANLTESIWDRERDAVVESMKQLET
ncbi:unnamed protein product [Penicillium salamii]|uniref:HNH nuclease domain-containing protein n=1 Tax=Penicillium salamii TaxID=1612424 RepID=A0A9W4IZ89_9EURO|nr:unnamed protein product [Penicillium salamii]CAG7967542.1 unnamed protein product [Penicillium salamii]CAG8003515.1 unnamed protein product [Penicillium salamii]CAG8051666.1 unnamed protein product [Penicillium salamii]CAG8199254.1 unnamed protein product [Penicillium salamii]